MNVHYVITEYGIARASLSPDEVYTRFFRCVRSLHQLSPIAPSDMPGVS